MVCTRQKSTTCPVTMYLKLQLLSVCSPEVFIKYKLKTYCEVVNTQFSLAYYRNLLVRCKRNQAGILLEQPNDPI